MHCTFGPSDGNMLSFKSDGRSRQVVSLTTGSRYMYLGGGGGGDYVLTSSHHIHLNAACALLVVGLTVVISVNPALVILPTGYL